MNQDLLSLNVEMSKYLVHSKGQKKSETNSEKVFARTSERERERERSARENVDTKAMSERVCLSMVLVERIVQREREWE